MPWNAFIIIVFTSSPNAAWLGQNPPPATSSDGALPPYISPRCFQRCCLVTNFCIHSKNILLDPRYPPRERSMTRLYFPGPHPFWRSGQEYSRGDPEAFAHAVHVGSWKLAEGPPAAVHTDIEPVIFSLRYHPNFWHFIKDALLPVFRGLQHLGGLTNISQHVLLTNEHYFAVPHFARLDILAPNPQPIALTQAGAGNGSCFERGFTCRESRNKDYGGLQNLSRWILRGSGFTPREAPARPTLTVIHRAGSNTSNAQRSIVNLQALLDEVQRRAPTVQETPGPKALAGRPLMELMQDTLVLMGSHGAGLSNVMFLPPGACLIQLVGYDGRKVPGVGAFEAMAQEVGVVGNTWSATMLEPKLFDHKLLEASGCKDVHSCKFHLKSHNGSRFALYRDQNVRVDVQAVTNMVLACMERTRFLP